jgi:uncharacterized protein (TIGR02145 family)
MRKLLLTTAAVAAAMLAVAAVGTLWLSERGNKLMPESIFEMYDTFIDDRDGRAYRTVTIGGKKWMARNLNYQPKSGNSWCYEDSNSYCDKYGRLYDWHTALTVCPRGYRLPSREEWNDLAATAGGNKTAGRKLKAKSGWNRGGNGRDIYGFSALPGGDRYTDGKFVNAGYGGFWWTATKSFGNYAYGWSVEYTEFRNGNLNEDSYGQTSDGLSVRCVADRP